LGNSQLSIENFKRQPEFLNAVMAQYTKYEESRIIGSRALQLAQGAPFMIKLSDKELENMRYNPIEIAKLEFKQGFVPITTKSYRNKSKEM